MELTSTNTLKNTPKTPIKMFHPNPGEKFSGIFYIADAKTAKKILQFEKNMLLVQHNIIESGVKNPAFLLEGTFNAPNAPVAKNVRTHCHQTRL